MCLTRRRDRSQPRGYDSLKNYVGKDLVVTDGTTLLGADNRAGIAEIMTMAGSC